MFMGTADTLLETCWFLADSNNSEQVVPYSTPQKLNIWGYASAFLYKERGYAREEEGKR